MDVRRRYTESSFSGDEIQTRIFVDRFFEDLDGVYGRRRWFLQWATTLCRSVVTIGFYDSNEVFLPVVFKLKNDFTATIKVLRRAAAPLLPTFRTGETLSITV